MVTVVALATSSDPVTPPTRAEWVDALLRRAILSGEFAPGTRLRAEHLAERWGVSPTPLRETFMRLAGEGLVVVEPQRGARVAPLDIDSAVEIYELRLLLDPVALDRSIRAGGADLATQAESAFERLDRRHATPADHFDAHRAFHLTLISHCPNRRLVRQVEQLLDHSQRFQALGAGRGRRDEAQLEHRLLLDAVRASDRREATRLLKQHLQTTLTAIRSMAGPLPAP